MYTTRSLIFLCVQLSYSPCQLLFRMAFLCCLERDCAVYMIQFKSGSLTPKINSLQLHSFLQQIMSLGNNGSSLAKERGLLTRAFQLPVRTDVALCYLTHLLADWRYFQILPPRTVSRGNGMERTVKLRSVKNRPFPYPLCSFWVRWDSAGNQTSKAWSSMHRRAGWRRSSNGCPTV